MDPKDDSRQPSRPHGPNSYEDPHYHDDDLELPDEAGPKKRTAPGAKPARRIPPPPRRRPRDDY